MSGSGISWAICKSAPRSRQITTPAPNYSVFTGRMPFLPPNQQRQSTEGKCAYVRMCLNPCKSDKHEKFAVSARRTRNVFSVSGKGNMHAKCRNVKPGDCRRRLSVNDSLESGRFALRTRDFLQPLNDLWHRCRCRSNINTLYFSEYVPHFVTKLT